MEKLQHFLQLVGKVSPMDKVILEDYFSTLDEEQQHYYNTRWATWY